MKIHVICLAQNTTPRHRWDSDPPPLGHELGTSPNLATMLPGTIANAEIIIVIIIIRRKTINVLHVINGVVKFLISSYE